MLTEKEVLHVLDLARLDASDEEIKKYQVELFKMIESIDKIKDIKDYDSDLMIAPWTNNCKLRENDSIKIDECDVLSQVPDKKGNFIAVSVEVLKDE